jgi:hypothetical protein
MMSCGTHSIGSSLLQLASPRLGRIAWLELITCLTSPLRRLQIMVCLTFPTFVALYASETDGLVPWGYVLYSTVEGLAGRGRPWAKQNHARSRHPLNQKRVNYPTTSRIISSCDELFNDNQVRFRISGFAH